MIRALRPTDALAYVAFRHQVTREADVEVAHAGRRGWGLPVVAGFFGRSLALEPGRESWVQIDHGRISGLVGAKRREGADVWDVDELVLVSSADSERTCTRLLEHMLSAAVDEGIQTVFLRLADDDPAQQWVRQVGFFQYCLETWYYRAELPALASSPQQLGLRQRRPADHQSLFQLYCSVVPFRVRQAEGMTLHEWRWTDGWATRSVGVQAVLGSSRVDYVRDGEGRLRIWLQVDHRRRQLSLLSEVPEVADLSAILRFGIARLGRGRSAWCAARDYQAGLGIALEDNDFVPARRYALFARGLVARVPELKLVPVRAS
jgi:hypothetical protein